MVAIDTSTLIAFFRGERGKDVDAFDQALELGQVVLPPVVLTEMLSNPGLDRRVVHAIAELPVIEVLPGFWERAGRTRAKILAKRLRARLADALISQACLDHGLPLISRDGDFKHFARYAALRLI